MSEVETISQRMREHLLGSGLLETVAIELQEKSLVLVLSPHKTLTLSPQYERIMRFCLNFLGDSLSHALTSSVFTWCAAHVGGVYPDRTCPIWVKCSHLCGYMGIDVLCELILLGLRVSQSLSLSPISPQDFHSEDLLGVYRAKEEVLDFYEHFVTHVIQAGDDLPTEKCTSSLRDLWLCCPKHRFLFVQRLMLNDWLHHIFWEWDPIQEYSELPDTRYLLEVPTEEELKQILSDYLGQTWTEQQWLHARFAFLEEKRHWEYPTQQCQHQHHISWACCAVHTTLNAISYLFNQWLEWFDALYHVSEMVDEQGHSSGLFSANGVALLIHLAKLDTKGIEFTGWFEDVPSIDVSRFHHRRGRTS